MEFYDLDMKGVLALRNAIVKQAAKDYIKYYVMGANKQPLEVRSIERWFLSPQFDLMNTGYSGKWFIKNLQEMATAGISIKHRDRVQIKNTVEAEEQWM